MMWMSAAWPHWLLYPKSTQTCAGVSCKDHCSIFPRRKNCQRDFIEVRELLQWGHSRTNWNAKVPEHFLNNYISCVFILNVLILGSWVFRMSWQFGLINKMSEGFNNQEKDSFFLLKQYILCIACLAETDKNWLKIHSKNPHQESFCLNSTSSILSTTCSRQKRSGRSQSGFSHIES